MTRSYATHFSCRPPAEANTARSSRRSWSASASHGCGSSGPATCARPLSRCPLTSVPGGLRQVGDPSLSRWTGEQYGPRTATQGGDMADVLWRRTASELAELIRSGQVSSVEVVEAHLERIEAVNPELNAVVLVLADQALEAAKLADQRKATGDGELGPLHGVPVTIKENIDVAGTPTTNGVVALREAVAPVDAPLVERLRAAGAIVVGRTNLPDMGLRISTDCSLWGLTRNPWHPDLTAGGSSGGEASALASGMSPLGAGNDIGGSLRN